MLREGNRALLLHVVAAGQAPWARQRPSKPLVSSWQGSSTMRVIC